MRIFNQRLARRPKASAAAILFLAAAPIVSVAAPDPIVRFVPLAETCCGVLNLTISADGRYAAYRSAYPSSTTVDIFVHDLIADTRTRANLMVTGGEATAAQCDAPVMSSDARFIAFGCIAKPMGASVPSGAQAYYVYDRSQNTTELLPMTNANQVYRSIPPAISADGRYITYRTTVSGNSATEIYVRDMVNKTTKVTAAKFARIDGVSNLMTVSKDGRYLGYSGYRSLSVPVIDSYVYDIVSGVTEQINVNPAGGPPSGTSGSNTSIMSADGNLVSFVSTDVNLTSPAAQAGGGVFLRDRRIGKTDFISGITKGRIRSATLSANGRYVAYIADPVSTTITTLYVYDRLTKVSRTVPAAVSNLTTINGLTSSADGRYLAFESVTSRTGARSIGIVDFGVAAGLAISSDKLSLTEGGLAGTYTAVLKQVPNANVTVSIQPNPQLTVARSQLIFTPANWNIPQVVSVKAVQDGVQEGAHTGTVTHTVTSTDIDYTVIPTATVEVAISDAIRPTIVLPASVWSRSDLPVTGTAAPGATVLLTAVNRTSGWMASASTIADQQGQWNHLLTGLANGVVDLDAQADGIKSAVQTVTVKLEAGPF